MCSLEPDQLNKALDELGTKEKNRSRIFMRDGDRRGKQMSNSRWSRRASRCTAFDAYKQGYICGCGCWSWGEV